MHFLHCIVFLFPFFFPSQTFGNVCPTPCSNAPALVCDEWPRRAVIIVKFKLCVVSSAFKGPRHLVTFTFRTVDQNIAISNHCETDYVTKICGLSLLRNGYDISLRTCRSQVYAEKTFLFINSNKLYNFKELILPQNNFFFSFSSWMYAWITYFWGKIKMYPKPFFFKRGWPLNINYCK